MPEALRDAEGVHAHAQLGAALPEGGETHSDPAFVVDEPEVPPSSGLTHRRGLPRRLRHVRSSTLSWFVRKTDFLAAECRN